MSDLEHERERLLAHYRGHHHPSEARHASVLAAIEARIGTGDPGPELPEPPPASNGIASLKVVALGAIVVAGLAIGGALVAGTPKRAKDGVAQRDPHAAPANSVPGAPPPIDASPSRHTAELAGPTGPPPRPAVPPPDAPVGNVAREGGSTSDPGVRAIEASDPEADRAQRRAPRSAPHGARSSRTADTDPSPSLAPADRVAAELALIKRAKAATDSEPARGLALLRQHRRNFPDGVLTDERDVLEIEVLCRLGKVDAADSKARRFVKRRPTSPLRGRASAGCDRGAAP